MNVIVRMMRVRKPISAALVGVAVLVLALAALGGGSGTNFGDPLPGLSPDLQARFVAGQANFSVTRHARDRARARLQQHRVQLHVTPPVPSAGAASSLRPGTGR